MPTKFDDYIREVEEKAKAEGPEAVARWDAFNAHFAMAREVRELRKERHLTQKQLAAASGIHQAEISRIERRQTQQPARSPPCSLRSVLASASSSARITTWRARSVRAPTASPLREAPRSSHTARRSRYSAGTSNRRPFP
jgi:hypothetical protein